MQEPRSRRSFLAAAGSTTIAGLSGCLGLFKPENFDIGMTAVAFRPPELTVSAGTTVVWQNTSSRSHGVTAYEASLPEGAAFFSTGGYETEAEAREAWESEGEGVIATSERFEHTFEIPGTYQYVCLPHETTGMVGNITVTE